MVAQSGHPLPLPSHFHFHRTSTSIGLPLPSTFHFHAPCFYVDAQIVFRHMSVGVLSMLCSNAIKMVVVLLLLLCTPVNALPPFQRTRDEIIQIQGFQYGLILCFLVSVYGICIGCISWPSVGISR